MKKIKKILLGMGAFVLLLVVAAVVLPFVIDVNRFKDPILQKVEGQINGKVTLDRIGLKLFPFIGLKLQGLTVKNLEAPFADTPLLKLGEMDFRVQLKSILERKIVASLVLQAPEIQFIKRKEGSNVDALIKKTPAEPTPAPPVEKEKPAEKKGSLVTDVVVEKVMIRDGLLVYDDQTVTDPEGKPKPPMKISGLRLTVTNAVLTDTSKPIGIDLGLRLFDAKAENIAFQGSVAVDQKAKNARLEKAKLLLAGSPIAIDATVEDYAVKKKVDLKVDAAVAMNSIYAFLPEAKKKFPPGSSLEGTLGLKVTANGTPEAMALKAGVDLKQASIKYGDTFVKPTGATLDLSIDANYAPAGVTIDNFAFHLLSAAITGKGKAELAGARNLSLNLQSSPLDLKELLTLSPANKGQDVEGAPQFTFEAHGPLSKPDALELAGTLSAASLRYAKYKLTHLASAFAYGGKVAHLKELGFDLFEGRFGGSANVDLKEIKPSWDAVLHIEKLNMNLALTEVAAQPDILFGGGNLDLTLNGKGTKAEEIKKTLSGNGHMSVKDGELRAVNIAPGIFNENLLKGLDTVTKKFPVASLAGLSFSTPAAFQDTQSTHFQELATSFTIQEGKILMPDLNLNSSGDTLQLGGNVNLDLILDFKGKYLLSKGNTDAFIANEKIRHYLVDGEGRFGVPFTITGGMKSPVIAPDLSYVNELMEKALANYAKEELEQKAAAELAKAKEKAAEEAHKAQQAAAAEADKAKQKAAAAAEAEKQKAADAAKAQAQKAGSEAGKALKGLFH